MSPNEVTLQWQRPKDVHINLQDETKSLTIIYYRYADAEEDCSLSISLDDIFAKSFFNRAVARARQGKLEDAIEGTCTCHVATLTTLTGNSV